MDKAYTITITGIVWVEDSEDITADNLLDHYAGELEHAVMASEYRVEAKDAMTFITSDGYRLVFDGERWTDGDISFDNVS